MARGVLTGVVLGIAYPTKEPAAFVALALLVDSALRRRWRQTAAVALGIGAIVGLEHAYYVGTTGDLLFRFHALSAHNRNFAGAAQTGPPVAAATPVEGVIDHLTPGVTVTSGEGAQPPTDAVAVEDEVEADDDAPLSRRRRGLRRAFITYPQKMIEPNADFGLHSVAASDPRGRCVPFLPSRSSSATCCCYGRRCPGSIPTSARQASVGTLPIPPAERYIDPLLSAALPVRRLAVCRSAVTRRLGETSVPRHRSSQSRWLAWQPACRRVRRSIGRLTWRSSA